MSFGQLKRLLIVEDVVAPDCRDTEIRDHIAHQVTPPPPSSFSKILVAKRKVKPTPSLAPPRSWRT